MQHPDLKSVSLWQMCVLLSETLSQNLDLMKQQLPILKYF